jgi:hypothetical protein
MGSPTLREETRYLLFVSVMPGIMLLAAALLCLWSFWGDMLP